MRQIWIAAAALVASMGALAGSADAEHVRRGRLAHDVAPGHRGDQRGCYWAEGRRYCARYCYWEVDGLRYCRERRRLAHPQGDPWFRPDPPEPPIYPAYRRPR